MERERLASPSSQSKFAQILFFHAEDKSAGGCQKDFSKN
jgi:hypothetical protein